MDRLAAGDVLSWKELDGDAGVAHLLNGAREPVGVISREAGNAEAVQAKELDQLVLHVRRDVLEKERCLPQMIFMLYFIILLFLTTINQFFNVISLF